MVCELIILFFLFSFIGWLTEVILKYIQYRRFINRGFLIGPYCPIYGFGVVAVTVLVGGLIGRHGTMGETFLAGLIICGALEYFTSWYMEKLFHARWWDYSQKPMNLHGRIWIGNLILFGLGSAVIVWWIDPLFYGWIERWPDFWVKVTAAALCVLMAADAVASHFLMDIVRKEIDSKTGDSTEAVSREIRALLRDKTLLLRRINEAYPNLQARPAAMTKELKAAVNSYKKASRELKEDLRKEWKARKSGLDKLVEEYRGKIKAASQNQKEALARLKQIQRKFRRKEDL